MKSINKKEKVYLLFTAICSMLFAICPRAHAASLYFEPSATTLEAGTAFTVTLKLDPQGQNINALEGNIILPKDLQLLSIQDGNSLVGIWVERPQERNGVVAFSGIIPGGYSGERSPYYKGVKPGEVLTLRLKSYPVGSQTISLADAKVLLNDGKGTEAKTTTASVSVAMIASQPTGALQTPELLDHTPPEEFTPLVTELADIEPDTFFLIFETVDKESGIDHYEVAEKKALHESAPAALTFKLVASPYRLSDQGQRSYIYVKAIDRAGNERVAMLLPKFPPRFYEVLPWQGILLVVGTLLAVLVLLWPKKAHS